MLFIQLIPYYIAWHYTQGVKDLFNIFKTFVWFVPSFFSVDTLLKTLFSPFQRLSENYRGGLDIEDFMSVLIVNVVMRLVGFFARSVIIFFGIFTFLFTIIFGIFSIFVWLLLPALAVFLFVISVIAFFKTS